MPVDRKLTLFVQGCRWDVESVGNTSEEVCDAFYNAVMNYRVCGAPIPIQPPEEFRKNSWAVLTVYHHEKNYSINSIFIPANTREDVERLVEVIQAQLRA